MEIPERGRYMKKLKTVKEKQLAVFILLIAFLVLAFGIIFHYAKNFAINNIYQQMDSQAEYYVNSVDSQLKEVMRQQSDFFVDRQLVFLADTHLLSDYEKRNALLSVKEKLFILKTSNTVIKEATLYIPDSDYVITPYSFDALDEQYRERLAEVKEQLGRLTPENEDLVYSLAETPYVDHFSPHFYLQLVFDKKRFVEQLNSFSVQEGGACWDNAAIDWFLEDTAGMGMAKEILEELKKTEDRKVRVGGMTFLVSTKESEYLGTLVQYCSEDVVLKEMKQYTRVFYILVFAALGLAIIFSGYTERLINRPLQKLYAAFRELQKGNLELSISHTSEDEFAYIYNGFNHTVSELKRMIDEVYVQKNLAAQAELKQLQAQINPHFLYNSFFLLSARAAREDMEGVQELADYLGAYFRYITRDGSDIVTLQDEMKHAEAYARIQESRFSSRMELRWEELPKWAETILVPRLIIQPILENSYKYGLENREEGGILQIFYKQEADKLLLCIENNGEATPETIQVMKSRLLDTYEGEVTGMVNIHRRLKSFFGQDQGISIEKGALGGVLITIRIPFKKEV